MPTVLYLAHGFPPASGSGAVRALAFARYLPAYGWRPLVVTPGEAWAAHPDVRLLAEVPTWLEVVRTRSFEPRPTRPDRPTGSPCPATRNPVGPPSPATTHRVENGRHFGVTQLGDERHPQRHTVEFSLQAVSHPRAWPFRRHTDALARQTRRHLGHARRFPDAHLGWLPFAVAAGLHHAASVDVLHSSSGPFTSHLVGLVLHRLTGRPWVLELRDGWYRWNRAIFPDYPAWRGPLEARLESAAIHAAARVVCMTEHMSAVFRSQYPDLPAHRFAVVPNGFDPAHVPPPSEDQTHAGFEVLHAGALYYGRPISPFLQAAGRLMGEDPQFAQVFRLRLVGDLDETARAEVDGSTIAEKVVVHGHLDHPATLAAERAADLLLLVANTTPGAEATVPGKLFEYLASRRPVLAIAPAASATADILQRTGGGWLADSNSPEVIYRQLQAALRAHRRGASCSANEHELARFDRRRLAGDLARVLDDALLA